MELVKTLNYRLINETYYVCLEYNIQFSRVIVVVGSFKMLHPCLIYCIWQKNYHGNDLYGSLLLVNEPYGSLPCESGNEIFVNPLVPMNSLLHSKSDG